MLTAQLLCLYDLGEIITTTVIASTTTIARYENTYLVSFFDHKWQSFGVADSGCSSGSGKELLGGQRLELCAGCKLTVLTPALGW